MAPAMKPVAAAVLFEFRDVMRKRSTRLGMALPVAPDAQLGTRPDVDIRTRVAAE